MEKELICGDCNMVFRSTALLEKHKALFCIGSEVGHLRVQRHSSEPLMRDKPGSVDPKQTKPRDLFQQRDQGRNVTRWRSADVKAKDMPSASQTESATLQDLTDEFHELRMSIKEKLPVSTTMTADTETNGHQLSGREGLEDRRELAMLHERQLALIHSHNQQLERQRDGLARQARALSGQSGAAHLEGLLTELREQEERNEETLQQLAEHLHMLHVKKTSVAADQRDPCRNKKIHHGSYELIPSVDGPLSVQIKALQRTNMQSGESHPAIVARMIELQAEAQSQENIQPAAGGKSTSSLPLCPDMGPPRRGLTWELLAVEQENQRLEEEILRIQLAQQQHHKYEAAVRTELELIQTENLLQISSLQAEMQRRKEAARLRRPPPPPPPPPLLPHQPKTHIHAPLSLLQAGSSFSPLGRCILDPLDSLGPAPYDPAAGFVVFYDLMLGVAVSQRALRLAAALYSEGQEVGPPTWLPPVQWLPGASLPSTHSLTSTNRVPLSVTQPVHSLQPTPSLSLVVEVQTASELDVLNQHVFKLESCGWTRMHLFDQHNQLCSGHWRVPVRSLPIRPTLSLAQLNSVAQVANMELCLRLVNGRDGDAQTLEKPDPSSTSHYKYPPVASHPATIHGNAAHPASAPQQRVSAAFTDHQDAPPTEEVSQR